MDMDHGRKVRLSIPQDLHGKIGNKEKIIELVRAGLLQTEIANLESEIADLIEKTERAEKRMKELPHDIERMEELLRKVRMDQKTLESLLNERR